VYFVLAGPVGRVILCIVVMITWDRSSTINSFPQCSTWKYSAWLSFYQCIQADSPNIVDWDVSKLHKICLLLLHAWLQVLRVLRCLELQLHVRNQPGCIGRRPHVHNGFMGWRNIWKNHICIYMKYILDFLIALYICFVFLTKVRLWSVLTSNHAEEIYFNRCTTLSR